MPEVERIGDDWRTHTGHVVRYVYAADRTQPGEQVNDIACGIGYGSTCFPTTVNYRGYDKAGVSTFPGEFHVCDLNDVMWMPYQCDVTVCFETIEHVEDPPLLAAKLTVTTKRAVFVSTPTVPTKQGNPYHLHDFTPDDVPRLFPRLHVVDCWAQPEEQSHVWHLEW